MNNNPSRSLSHSSPRENERYNTKNKICIYNKTIIKTKNYKIKKKKT